MPNRRTFLKTAAASTAALGMTSAVHAGGSDVIKIGLIGCGGRGRGAAADALGADANCKVVALCDIFPEVVEQQAAELSKRWKDRVDVKDRLYSGFDGYKQLIDNGGCDLVLMAAPPGFRPMHLEYAIDAGKHVFAEKPMAVDAPGIRRVLAAAKKAKDKNLMCASGFCYRHEKGKIDTIKRIHDGDIGDVIAMQVSYNTGLLWHRGDKPAWTPMEKQIRNWLYYTWLSGDHLIEQAIHNIDKACWVMNEYPIAATALGGRQMRTDPKFGNIWDHFSIVYEYADGRRVFAQCRQMGNCKGNVSDVIFGSEGRAVFDENANPREQCISNPKKNWKETANWGWRPETKEFVYRGPEKGMYLQEHIDFFQALRAGKPYNDMESAAMSTLMAILGRQAGYTGQRITWKQMLESKESLAPSAFNWGDNDVKPVAIPGVTKFA